MTAPLTLFPPAAPADVPVGAVPVRARVRFWVGAVSLFATVLLGTLAAWALVPGLLQPWNTSVVMSGSMEPRIRTGDAVVWRTTAPDPLPDNAVVIFSQGERTVIHRVVDRPGADHYVTKGDANANPDSDVLHPGQVHGVGQLLVPIVGLPAVWWSNGQFGLVVVAGLLVLAAVWTAHRTWDPDQDPWREEVTLEHPGTRDRDALVVRSPSAATAMGSAVEDDASGTAVPEGGLLPVHLRATLLRR